MRYLTICLLIIFAASVGYAQKQSRSGLSGYLGKDLRKLDDAAEAVFWRAFRALTGDKAEKKRPFQTYEAWSVNRFRSGKAEWMFVEVYPGYNIPDVSGVRIHVFDKNWKRLAKQSFPTGYRFFLKQATVAGNAVLKQDLLVVKVTSAGPFLVLPGGKRKPAFEQGNFQRQFYAFLGDRMALVRLEDDKNKLVQNSYRWETPMKGGAIPKRTRDAWIKSLSSDSVAERLATLVWLSGFHLSSAKKRFKNASQESVEHSKLFESVRDAPATRQALDKLRKSKSHWLREYAGLVD